MKSFISKTVIPFAACMMVADFPLGAVINLIRFSAFRNALSDYGKLTQCRKLIYICLHPFASLVMSVGLLKSWRKSRVTWSGVTYELSSVDESIVCNTKNLKSHNQ